MSFLSGGGGSPPPTPPFHKLDINKIANKALNQDLNWYSSNRFPVFPGLMAMRQNEIEDAYKRLTGPLAPELQQDFMQRATATTDAVTGGGDPFSGMALQKGSFAKGGQSASFARQDLANQDYNRSRFESLISQNPVPQLGLSQSDIASMYIYNTNAQNAFSMSNYANQNAYANAQYANQQAMYNTIGNTISGLGNIWANYQLNQGGFGGGAIDWSNSGFDFSNLGL